MLNFIKKIWIIIIEKFKNMTNINQLNVDTKLNNIYCKNCLNRDKVICYKCINYSNLKKTE